jgi:hypothetical protein
MSLLAIYSASTGVTPVTPQMLAKTPTDLRVPMGPLTPTPLLTARLFAVILMQSERLRELKDKPQWRVVSEHIDPSWIRLLSIDDILSIREIWAMDEDNSAALDTTATDLTGSLAESQKGATLSDAQQSIRALDTSTTDLTGSLAGSLMGATVTDAQTGATVTYVQTGRTGFDAQQIVQVRCHHDLIKGGTILVCTAAWFDTCETNQVYTTTCETNQVVVYTNTLVGHPIL